jgi:multidrug efflux system membrane fusion protein
MGLALAGPAGCRQAQTAASAPAEAVAVKTAKAARLDVPLRIQSIGSVEPYATVNVKPQVGGVISQVCFAEGQRVHKNQKLFQIDPRPLDVALQLAKANLARDQALANQAKLDRSKIEELYQHGNATRDELDKAASQAESLAATVKADQAAVHSAELTLAYCDIASPLEGIVGSLDVNAGNVVKINDTQMLTINQVQPIYVSFTVPQQHLNEIRRWQAQAPLEVVAALPGETALAERGKLSFIDNAIDQTTGTVRLRATFGNEDEQLWPGRYVDVVLTLKLQRQAVVVPLQALQMGQQGPFVYVLQANQTVTAAAVQVDRTVNGFSVVSEGLTGDETVITDGQLQLRPDSLVKVKESAPAPTSLPAPLFVQPAAAAAQRASAPSDQAGSAFSPAATGNGAD